MIVPGPHVYATQQTPTFFMNLLLIFGTRNFQFQVYYLQDLPKGFLCRV